MIWKSLGQHYWHPIYIFISSTKAFVFNYSLQVPTYSIYSLLLSFHRHQQKLLTILPSQFIPIPTSNVFRFVSLTFKMTTSHIFWIAFKLWRWLGHSKTFILISNSNFWTDFAEFLGLLSFWNTSSVPRLRASV